MPITTGTTGVSVASKQRGGTEYQELVPAGASTGTRGTYTVTTTATAHVTANGNRRRIILQNGSSTVRIRFGHDSSITALNAPYIEVNDCLDTEVTSAIYLLAESGSVTVWYWEETN